MVAENKGKGKRKPAYFEEWGEKSVNLCILNGQGRQSEQKKPSVVPAGKRGGGLNVGVVGCTYPLAPYIQKCTKV